MLRLALIGAPVPIVGAVDDEVSSVVAFAIFGVYVAFVIALMVYVKRKERRHGR